MVKSYYSESMLFQCVRLEGLPLVYVLLMGATGVGGLGPQFYGGVFSRVIWGYARQLNDRRNLTMGKEQVKRSKYRVFFSGHKLFSALLLIRLDFRYRN